MEKKRLGTSDVFVTKLTFGAWAIGGWMWGGAEKKSAIDALHTSLDAGMTSIDTAPVYGFGRSERIVGEALKGKPRDKVEILSKYGMQWKEKKGQFFFDTHDNEGTPLKIYRFASKESVIRECEASLKRLNTDYIDLYQIHWPDPTTSIEETMEAIELLLEQGKIRAAGVCNYDLDLTKKASSLIPLASNQVPYSMLRRDIEKELIPWCSSQNISILAYSPLQRGLLTGKINTDFHFEKGDTRPNLPHFSKENIKAVNSFLDKIKPIAEIHNAKLSQLVIAWTLKQAGITVALVGARNSSQVLENVKAASLVLSKDDLHFIGKELKKLKLNL